MIGRGHVLARLLSGRRGGAAIEFGFVVPVMVSMTLGTIEISNAMRVQARLNATAGQLAEMIAGSQSVTEGSAEGPGGTLGDMCTAASYNLLPYQNTTLSAYIESTTVIRGWLGIQTAQDWANDKSCPAANPIGSFYETILLTKIADTPRSLFTLDGTPKASGGTMVLGYSAISLQLTYTYTNPIPFLRGRTLTFTAIAAARPRANKPVTCTYPSGNGSAPCPGVY